MELNSNQEQSNLLPPDLREQLYKDRKIRTEITKQSHLMFFSVYFSRYAKNPTARFQKEFFAITEDESIKRAIIVAFRGSAKSTIMTLSYPLWAILGCQQKKFVLILSQTQRQARQHLTNIKRELESNELLKNDLGPFQEESDEWGSIALVIPEYNAKIMAASTEQSVRGLKHLEHRPDLIICDDIEDLQSVQTKESRDKTHQWLTGDVIPSGDLDTTRLIMVGNLLHEDSVMMRLKEAIEQKTLDGVFRFYPLVDDAGNIAWVGKYPTMEDIERLRNMVGNDVSWHREYLLHIISGSERVVHPDWIEYYDYEKLPPRSEKYKYMAVGVDLAVSQRDTADYTSMVSALILGWLNEPNARLRIVIMPNPINDRLTFPETIDTLKALTNGLPKINSERPKVYIEDFGYQQALIQMMQQSNMNVEASKIKTGDKRSRIALTTHLIKDGTIVFPRTGCEELIRQLVGFGVEKHDDLADAFAILVNSVMQRDHYMPRIYWI
jgi:predicted phage terminase large subunit-like protein